MFLLFDIGGTNTRIAVSVDGKSISKSKIMPTEKDFEKAIENIGQTGSELAGGEKIEKIAGGVAGPLDQEKTMLVASPHIKSWIQKPLKQSLEKLFNTPVILEHDADLAGLAEATLGAGKGYKIVANLTIGTGIASTRIVEGKIDKNTFGFEAGHQIILVDGNACGCGGKGHLEAYVSGSGLWKTYGLKSEKITDPAVWDKTARFLAIGLNNTIVFWSPDIIVLGGSVVQNISLDKVRTYLREVLTIFPKAPQIVTSKLGDSAGLEGALLISQTA